MIKNKYNTSIFIASLFLLSCADTDIVSNLDEGVIESSKIVLTSEEFVSIAYDSPRELTLEEISNVVLNFQHNIKGREITTRSSKSPKVAIKKKFYISENDNVINTSATTRLSMSEELTIPIFEVELFSDDGEKNLAIVCGDERVPEVLFYINNYNSKIKFDNGTRYLLELSKKNILSDIQQVEYIKSAKKDSTLYKIARQLNVPKNRIVFDDIKDKIITTDETSTRNYNPGNQSGGESRPTSNIVGFVNPMSKVLWDQGYPYNYFMPVMMIYDDHAGEHEANINVGCANIAIGTLFSIIKPSMSLDNGEKVDWNYVTSVEEIYGIPGWPGYGSPQDLVDMISGLLAQIATATASEPFYEEKELLDINTETKYKKSVITQTTTTTINTVNYLKSMVNLSGDQNTKFNGNLAKQSLFKRNPVFLCGQGHILDTNGNIVRAGGGHAWLIDGVVITKQPRQTECDHYWSVNMGWGVGSKAYFRTSNNLQNCDVVFPYSEKEKENIAYYTQEMTMLYNITKK